MRYGHSLLLILFVLIIVAVFSGASAQGNEIEVAFVVGNYYYRIAIVSSNGIVPITNEQLNVHGRLSTPQWSPDGIRIAFTDSKFIYIVNADGSDLERFKDYSDDTRENIQNISWSPDGLTIAATIYSGVESYSEYWIRLIDTETLDERDITSGDYSDGMYGLSWSPDNKAIVFTSNRDSKIPEASGLYLLEIETGNISALTDIATRRRDDHYPQWSPDGKQIAFVSENDDDGRWDIYLLDVATSTFQRLPRDRDVPEIDYSLFGGAIDWSPDGEKIVFSACPDLYPEGCDLFTIHRDGTNLVQITHDDEDGDFDPSWKSTSINEG